MSATVEFPVSWRSKESAGSTAAIKNVDRSTAVQSSLMGSLSRLKAIDSRCCISRESLCDAGLTSSSSKVGLASFKALPTANSSDCLSRGSDLSPIVGGTFPSLFGPQPFVRSAQRHYQHQISTSIIMQQKSCNPFGFQEQFLEVIPNKMHASVSSDQLMDVSGDPRYFASSRNNIQNRQQHCASLSEKCRQLFSSVVMCKKNDRTNNICNGLAPPNASVRCADVTKVLEGLAGADTALSISPDFLADLIDTDLQLVLLLDCRTFLAYNANHIAGALNVSCADCISRKRLLCGRSTVGDLVTGCGDAKERYRAATERDSEVQLVLYDDSTTDFQALPATHPLKLTLSCIRKLNKDAYYLLGGLQAFHKSYSRLCSHPSSPPSRPLLYSPTTQIVDCDVDSAEISQILPYLYIGNERDAGDRQLVKALGISHIVNVTSHIPLHFESDSIKYKRLAASDSGCQNLKQYFADAIQFIDEAHSDPACRIMVHCQAGVSRSSTITIAYIMSRTSLSMLDTFRFVKSKRSIIAPNFNFMGQLLEFEILLKNNDEKKCSAVVQRCIDSELVTFITSTTANETTNMTKVAAS